MNPVADVDYLFSSRVFVALCSYFFGCGRLVYSLASFDDESAGGLCRFRSFSFASLSHACPAPTFVPYSTE